MSFLRTRRKVLRPVVDFRPDGTAKPERYKPEVVGDRKFASKRAAREYAQRRYLADKATEYYLRERSLAVIDGGQHLVKIGKRNAKIKPAVKVTNRYQSALPDNVPEGFEDRSYEHTGDTVRPVKVETMSDRKWTLDNGRGKVSRSSGAKAFWNDREARRMKLVNGKDKK